MRKLPVIAAFRVVLETTRKNIGVALLLLWPWLLLIVPVVAGFVWWSAAHPLDTNTVDLAQAAIRFIWSSGIAVLSLMGFSSVAVGWHRHSLLGELPTGFDVVRNDRITWRFLGNLIGMSIMLGLMIMVPLLIGASLAGGAWPPHAAAADLLVWFLTVALSVIVGAFGMRMLIKLVGIAIDDGRSTLSSCLAASKGNMPQLLALNLLLTVIFLPFTFVLERSIGGAQDLQAELLPKLGFLGLVLVDALQAFVAIVSLTILYRFFVQQRDIS